ncbi:hypothetical protein GCM10020001_044990 [Nonomuraea salmonea]
MGDRHDRAPVGAKALFEPGHGPVVQVVGGLVQQEQLGFGGQRGGQRQPGALAPGQRGHRPGPVEPRQPEPVQRGVHPRVGLVPAARLELRDQPGIGVHGGTAGGQRVPGLADPGLQ